LHITFVNHLPIGTASIYRQEGLARHLNSGGRSISFVNRRVSTNKLWKSKDRSRLNELKRFYSLGYPIKHWFEPFEYSILPNTISLIRSTDKNDIIHMNRANPYMSAISVSTQITKKARLVVDMEDWDGIGGYASLASLKLWERWAMDIPERIVPRRADAVLVASELVRRMVLERGVDRERIFYIPNGVDEEIFDYSISGEGIRNYFKIGSDPLIIFMSSFWSFEKWIQKTVLQTMKSVVEEVKNAKLLLVGPGNIEFPLKMSKQLGLDENIVFTGFLPRRLIPECIAAADVALHILQDHPYFRASCPMVIPEYMAMKKAIVATNIGETSRILSEDAGLLIDGSDSEDYTEGVLRLLSNPMLARSMGERAYKRMRDRHSYRVLSLEVMKSYRRALD